MTDRAQHGFHAIAGAVGRLWDLIAHDGLGRIPAAQRFNARINAWERRRRERKLWPLVDQLRAAGLQERADDLALALVSARMPS